jgi:hypothetical protein
VFYDQVSVNVIYFLLCAYLVTTGPEIINLMINPPAQNTVNDPINAMGID